MEYVEIHNVLETVGTGILRSNPHREAINLCNHADMDPIATIQFANICMSRPNLPDRKLVDMGSIVAMLPQPVNIGMRLSLLPPRNKKSLRGKILAQKS